MMNRTYSEMLTLASFEDRFSYLRLDGIVGERTFGSMRFCNQDFYRSSMWRSFRRDMIIRDFGCDLADTNREIYGRHIVLHHINPITPQMLERDDSLLIHPENVVCCSENTHRAIHYGDSNLLIKSPLIVERKQYDTSPWRL